MKDPNTRVKSVYELKGKHKAAIKKHFVDAAKIKREVKLGSYVSVVSEIYGVDVPSATTLIQQYEVTVNGDVQINPAFVLTVGDVVRVAEGHMVMNTGFAAKIIA